MDIQKEREAFEAVPEIKQWVSALRYGEKTGVYIAIDNDKHDGVANWVNGAWWMWQAAKAKAVPEGFVVVHIDALARAAQNIRELNNGEYYSEEIEENVCNIEAIIEAQDE